MARLCSYACVSLGAVLLVWLGCKPPIPACGGVTGSSPYPFGYHGGLVKCSWVRYFVKLPPTSSGSNYFRSTGTVRTHVPCYAHRDVHIHRRLHAYIHMHTHGVFKPYCVGWKNSHSPGTQLVVFQWHVWPSVGLHWVDIINASIYDNKQKSNA